LIRHSTVQEWALWFSTFNLISLCHALILIFNNVCHFLTFSYRYLSIKEWALWRFSTKIQERIKGLPDFLYLYCDTTPESQNSSLLGNGSVTTFPRKRTRTTMVHAGLVATQWCGKHMSAAVNQHATIHGAVFSVGATPRLYNEELMQLEWELSWVPELAVAADNWGSHRSWQNDTKGRGCASKTSCVIRSDSETVMKPLPGYD
jgi:hypothetical protein